MEQDALEVEAANESVERELQRKRRGAYNYYHPELRAKVGKYAAISGNKSAVDKFSVEIGKPISESTVHGFKKAYCSALSTSNAPINVITHLPPHGIGWGFVGDSLFDFSKFPLPGLTLSR